MNATQRQWFGVGGVMLGMVAFALFLSRPTPIEVGSAAPDFEAVNLATGRTVSLQREYAGAVTLVNVWATWCEPCKEEIPALQQLYEKLGPRGFRIAAVSIDRGDSASVTAFMQGYGVTFDVLHDPESRIQQTYQSSAVPESFLVDRQGRIVRIVYGAHPWASPANQRIIEALLAAPAT
jgi:peroxiredoxin